MSEEKALKEAIKALALRQSALKSLGMAIALAYGDPLVRFFILLERDLGLDLPESEIALGRFLEKFLDRLSYIDIILLASEKLKESNKTDTKALEILKKLWNDLLEES